jgi:hypothetical protein
MPVQGEWPRSRAKKQAAARYAMQLLVNDLQRLRCGTGYASWIVD